MSTQDDRGGRGAEVRVHLRDPHASVPVRLMEASCGLSPEARLVLLYMLDLGRRPGWTIYATQIQRALGYGNSRWPRCRRELEAAGYLVAERGHDASGDWQWTYDIYDQPAGGRGSVSSTPTVCGDANCGDAECGDRHIKTSHRSTGRKKHKQKQEQSAAGAAPTHATRGTPSNDWKGKSQPRAAGTRLPDDWAPDANMLAWAAMKRPDVDPNLETEKFLNYWIAVPGAKGRKLDWAATWRNWIIGARESSHAPMQGAAASKTLQSLESLEAFSAAYGRA